MIRLVAVLALVLGVKPALAGDADLILHHGRIVTVDGRFSIHQAVAIAGERILRVGSDEAVLQSKGARTVLYDLQGKSVLPGLIDSHVHPRAALTEYDHPIPTMESVEDVLAYVRARAKALKPGEWIQVRQVFITRLREPRYPTRAELDQAAPDHPVIFSTGPDASLNTLALKLSGLDKDFKVTDGGPGYIEKDPKTGEPTGMLRGCTRYVKFRASEKQPAEQDHLTRTLQLFRDYNANGLTSVADRDTAPEAIARYQKMLAQGDLPVRLFLSHHIDTLGPMSEIQDRIRAVARHPLCQDQPRLRIIGIKIYLDGGMLTGSAYLREPWGVSSIYGITDPSYRGALFVPKERLRSIVQTAVECDLQFTAHTVGDGAVQTLLEVYEEVNQTQPIRKTRPCISHSNFMSKEAVEKLGPLGVSVDVQPAWLYLDTHTLVRHFGDDRLRWFQPLRSIFAAGGNAGGGSDHMQKIGAARAINPYSPFLGMWTALTRQSKWHPRPLHPEEALTREQAIRFYTANNAYLLRKDHDLGSLEPGKLADLIVLDRDLLTCPVDEIKDTQVQRTYLGGKLVFRRE